MTTPLQAVTPLAPAIKPRELAPAGNLRVVCQRYLQRLAMRGRAVATLSAYECDLGQFLGYLAHHDCSYIQTVSVYMIEGWLDALLASGKCSARSAARKLEVVRGLFRFAELEGLVPPAANPIKSVTPPQWDRAPVVTPEEAVFLRVIESIPLNTDISIRDRAMFRLYYAAGLRREAVPMLDLYNPSDPPAWCVLPGLAVRYRAKGGATKVAAIDQTAQDYVDRWLQVRHRFEGDQDCPALFLGRRGDRLTPQAVHHRFKLWAKAAGHSRLHLHLLRHRRIGDITRTLGPQAAAQQAGHRHVSTTCEMYGHEAGEVVRKQIRDKCQIGGERC